MKRILVFVLLGVLLAVCGCAESETETTSYEEISFTISLGTPSAPDRRPEGAPPADRPNGGKPNNKNGGLPELERDIGESNQLEKFRITKMEIETCDCLEHDSKIVIHGVCEGESDEEQWETSYEISYELFKKLYALNNENVVYDTAIGRTDIPSEHIEEIAEEVRNNLDNR